MPVLAGVKAYNERSLLVKYHSQWIQTWFYESTPFAQGPLGDTTSQGFTEDSGNARADIPNASKNAISEIPPDTPGFYLNVFLVRKASGGWGPVIDLKQLNDHIDAPHFHMHTISSLLNTVEKADYTFKIDLQNAYNFMY